MCNHECAWKISVVVGPDKPVTHICNESSIYTHSYNVHMYTVQRFHNHIMVMYAPCIDKMIIVYMLNILCKEID